MPGFEPGIFCVFPKWGIYIDLILIEDNAVRNGPRHSINQYDVRYMKSIEGLLSGHVYLIDDNTDIRENLSRVLGQYGLTVESYGDVDAFISGSVELSPAVVLSDMVMPGQCGMDLLKRIRAAGWQTPVIFMSGLSEPPQIIEAMKQGAADFLWKPFSIDSLVAAIRKSLGDAESMMQARVLHLAYTDRYSTLTEREKEIFSYAATGFSNIEISDLIDVKPDTVKKHRGRVMEKMQADSLAALITMYDALKASISNKG